MCGAKLSEYHTGYRAFSRQVLESLPLLENSDDFVFDNQILAQILLAGFEVGEVSCPAAYFEEASSINFRRSLRYGLGVVTTSLQAFLHRKRLAQRADLRPAGPPAAAADRCPRPRPPSPEGLIPTSPRLLPCRPARPAGARRLRSGTQLSQFR